MTNPISVYYRRGQEPARVSTVAELDELLDRLHADPAVRDAPPLVELVTADESRALDVGLARPAYSVLLWHDDDADEVLASEGTIATDDDAAFNFGGTWTHIPDRSAIAVDLARRAAREFLTTGRRPTCVEWKLPAYTA
jgi:ethanolamine utilization protein EutQ (cupin superfamily)